VGEALIADVERFSDRGKIIEKAPYLGAFRAVFATFVIDESRREKKKS
jgi:hypothetical protein